MEEYIKLVTEAVRMSTKHKDGRDIVDKLYKKYKPLFKMVAQGQYYGISSVTGGEVRITYANREGIRAEIEIKVDTKWGQ